MDSDEDEGLSGHMFEEPQGYREAEKPATFVELAMLSGKSLRLRLVGHNPLWGHHLWNGGRVLASYIEEHASPLVKGKTVLELGAGAGLPSLVAAACGAQKVVVTDYPDVELIENLTYNINTSSLLASPSNNVVAEGYLWGSPVKPLLSHLSTSSQGFDILLLADLLFNHHCHDALVSTILSSLARTPSARSLVFFTPYRPWLLEKDMSFFNLCKERGLAVKEVVKKVMNKVMFEEDIGDELLRRTVFGYELKWKDLVVKE